MKNQIKEIDFLSEFTSFVSASQKGKRTKKNGSRILTGSVRKLEITLLTLRKFSEKMKFHLRIKCSLRFTKRELQSEKFYWKKFYQKFTCYLYDDLDCYDNYVGSVIKDIRTFFNYLKTEKNYPVGNFHKQFFIYKEDIPILCLDAQQLNFLIYDAGFEDSLRPVLKKAKDFLIAGCTVALRYSDLINLKRYNLEQENGEYYLKTQSKKTGIYTSIKIPLYLVEIFRDFKKTNRLLPYFNLVRLNLYFKELAEKAGWVNEVVKTRQKRGIAKVIYKDIKKKIHFRFCDLISSHTMRRTAITTMLSLQMPEHLVKKISGHAPNSKEFYKYVAVSQNYLNDETDKFFLKLNRLQATDFNRN